MTIMKKKPLLQIENIEETVKKREAVQWANLIKKREETAERLEKMGVKIRRDK